MAGIPTMSLKTMQFTPAGFTPLQYNFTPADMTTLERAMSQREARMNQAYQTKGSIDTALGQIEKALNPAESKWFADYKNNINNQINQRMDAGDYGDAYRKAVSLAGDVAKDDALIGRINAQEEYKKKITEAENRKNNGTVTKEAFNWWLAHNQYKYEPGEIHDGKELVGKLADLTPLYDRIDFDKEALLAAQMVEEEAGSSTTSNSWSKGNSDGSGSAGSAKNSLEYHRKKQERIVEVLKARLSSQEKKNQLQQEYDVTDWSIKQEVDKLNSEINNPNISSEDKANLEQQIQEQKASFYRNGSKITYDDWLKEKIDESVFAKNLSYDRQSTVHETSSHSQAATAGGRGGSGGSDEQSGLVRSALNALLNVKGPTVRMLDSYDTSTMDTATSGVLGIMGNFYTYDDPRIKRNYGGVTSGFPYLGTIFHNKPDGTNPLGANSDLSLFFFNNNNNTTIPYLPEGIQQSYYPPVGQNKTGVGKYNYDYLNPSLY